MICKTFWDCVRFSQSYRKSEKLKTLLYRIKCGTKGFNNLIGSPETCKILTGILLRQKHVLLNIVLKSISILNSLYMGNTQRWAVCCSGLKCSVRSTTVHSDKPSVMQNSTIRFQSKQTTMQCKMCNQICKRLKCNLVSATCFKKQIKHNATCANTYLLCLQGN